jgi:hypothetical protein
MSGSARIYMDVKFYCRIGMPQSKLTPEVCQRILLAAFQALHAADQSRKASSEYAFQG